MIKKIIVTLICILALPIFLFVYKNASYRRYIRTENGEDLNKRLENIAKYINKYSTLKEKKEKEEKKMRENLQVGDEIVTIGGIYGRVISLKEDTFVIESLSDHSKLTIARWAMQQNLTVHDDTPSK